MLGPGGSGKSTLLRALGGGTRRPEFWHRGTANVSGSLACLLQRRQPPPGEVASIVCPEDPGRARGVVERVWANEPYVRRRLEAGLGLQASTGDPMLWRLAAYTAAVGGTESVLLLDEPEAGLRGEAWTAMARQLAGERGRRTIVLVTHHLMLARDLTDTALLLVDGRVLESSTTRDFFERPTRQRTRDFVRTGG